jgi:hypothetical protein
MLEFDKETIFPMIDIGINDAEKMLKKQSGWSFDLLKKYN